MIFDDVRAMMLALPGVEEGSSYGTPGFRVRKRLLARLKEDGETLVIRIGLDEKAFLMEADPDVFFETDHYRGWPWMLVRMKAVDPGTLKRLVVQHWREVASKALIKQYDADHG